MKKLKSGILALLVLVMLVAGIGFTLLNPQAVELDLFVFRLPPISVALLLIAALAGGFVLGVLASALSTAGRKLRPARSRAVEGQR
ncbi:lipopolysaccharide assembly protein LapA domain-containing protein [Hahella sp. SMD15-11]|uniref:Lipopolysaccharide assembly protein LapA domain-containing protein n=1 Tax=Thermohahella caldifontis TaxID=3142973 RepID=A0AB39UWZ7_9GAMM